MEINLIDIDGTVQKIKNQVTTEAKSRGYRAANELRNAALNVLRGQRSGRVYRKPFTKRATYTASAPGEPPAVRSGTLRRSWKPRAQSEKDGTDTIIRPAIWTDVQYAPMLEDGAPNMAPRPYVDAIVAQAEPKVKAIYSQPYIT